MSHRFPVAAVECKGAAHHLIVVAGDLQSVGASAGVALIDGDAPIVLAFVRPLAVTQEMHPMHLHDAVEALEIGRCMRVLSAWRRSRAWTQGYPLPSETARCDCYVIASKNELLPGG